ncbi:uncharacterized protein SCHCODRAFT_02672261 [Schizophyllum commune H4-8]|uniref:uncharacterized protein n=1 Tax=Schizophyllum commune (strain H4-8 / FGSC 9210) TaxID=578458 RepID=UPI0021603583|nr:uncharacterized protein SCHCODRAFT_02672261 [Schizophyllum commune H4-8]KAI5887096.1 hypothetical protein SCHCODRAFT_02672261 [Schizophyllum commune H4-8]
MFTTLSSFVETAIRHVHGAFGCTPDVPATGETSRVQSTVAQRSATESSQSDGGSSDTEADCADGTPRFRGRNPPRMLGGQGAGQGGRSVCPAFNSQAGCRSPSCLLEHRCELCRERHSSVICGRRR